MRVALPLRDGPGLKYIVVGSLGQNALVSVVENQDGWAHIDAGPNANGWAPIGALSPNRTAAIAIKQRSPRTFDNTAHSRDGGR